MKDFVIQILYTFNGKETDTTLHFESLPEILYKPEDQVSPSSIMLTGKIHKYDTAKLYTLYARNIVHGRATGKEEGDFHPFYLELKGSCSIRQMKRGNEPVVVPEPTRQDANLFVSVYDIVRDEKAVAHKSLDCYVAMTKGKQTQALIHSDDINTALDMEQFGLIKITSKALSTKHSDCYDIVFELVNPNDHYLRFL